MTHSFLSRSLLLFFFAAMAAAFLVWPVGGFHSDSDIWYHLSGGRYFFEHWKIPDSAYFSFSSKADAHWPNYYWLFQAMVYSLYRCAGYYGLILCRTAFFLLTLLVILHYCLAKKRLPTAHASVATLLFCAYALAIVPRELFVVRPHLISYLFIVLTIYLIEEKRRLLGLLPLIGMAWSNLHGLAYPLLVLIIAAYLLEAFIDFLRRSMRPRRLSRTQRLLLILSLYSVLLTPHGLSLIGMPFELSPFVQRTINEMRPLTPGFLLRFDFSRLSTFIISLQPLLLLFNIIGAVFLSVRRRMRISHLVLFFGAGILYGQGVRFTYEALLLTLPVSVSFVRLLAEARPGPKPAVTLFLRATACCLLPLLLLIHLLIVRPGYPLALQKFPLGTVAFLKHIDVGGRVFNEHNSGGFVQWHLVPRYKIFMDLQMSLFTDVDLYQSVLARRDPVVFKRVVDIHRPDFICVAHDNPGFQQVLAASGQENWVPVFIDDGEILFVDRRRQPQVAADYGLKHLDPFAATALDYRRLDAAQRMELLQEVLKMKRIYDKSALINTIACNLLIQHDDLITAERLATRIIRYHPDNHIGYALKGQVRFSQQRYAEALSWFRKAGAKPSALNDAAVFENLHATFFKLEKYDKALETALRYFNVFNERLGYNDLYKFGIYAVGSDEQSMVHTLMAFSSFKTPTEDRAQIDKMKAFGFWKLAAGN